MMADLARQDLFAEDAFTRAKHEVVLLFTAVGIPCSEWVRSSVSTRKQP